MQQSVAGDDGESDADARAWQRAGSPRAALRALREARGEVHELKRYVQRLVREELALAPGRDPWRERSREELDIERSVLRRFEDLAERADASVAQQESLAHQQTDLAALTVALAHAGPATLAARDSAAKETEAGLRERIDELICCRIR